LTALFSFSHWNTDLSCERLAGGSTKQKETQMRTFACAVFVLSLGSAGTAVAHGGEGGASGGGTGTGFDSAALMTFRPQYRYRYHHRDTQHLKGKIATRGAAKADHHNLRPLGYAKAGTHRHDVSSGTSITQTLINNTYTLLPGLPLLGLDPRSPSTWALYNQMLPPLFSEVSASTPAEPAQE
jgi:hypothetical protein